MDRVDVVMARDMTEAQRLEWGAAESAARKASLAVVKTADALAAAQASAESRRRAIGASRSWASSAVIAANRRARVQGGAA